MPKTYDWFDHVARIRHNGRSAELLHPTRCRRRFPRRTASQHSDGLCHIAAACMVWNNERHATQYDTWDFDRWLQAQGIRPWHEWHRETGGRNG